PAIHGLHRRARLLDRDARLQPREEVGPVAAAVVEALEGLREPAHGNGREDLRLDPDRRALESPRRDADNGHRLAVDDERLVQYVRVERELPLPVRVAQDHDVRFPGREIVLRTEEPADRRLQTEGGKIAAGHEQAVPVLRLAAGREVGAERDMRGDSLERRLRALQVAKHGVAEDLLAVADLAARVGPGLRSG